MPSFEVTTGTDALPVSSSLGLLSCDRRGFLSQPHGLGRDTASVSLVVRGWGHDQLRSGVSHPSGPVTPEGAGLGPAVEPGWCRRGEGPTAPLHEGLGPTTPRAGVSGTGAERNGCFRCPLGQRRLPRAFYLNAPQV